MKKIKKVRFNSLTMVTRRERTIDTSLDLVNEISSAVRTALGGDLAEMHIQKIRSAMGDLAAYFGETWEDSLPVEWLLAVCPDKVAKTSSKGSRLDLSERAHRVRLVQLHACAFGIHVPSALEMLLIEGYAAQLRREEACKLRCAQERSL